MDIFKKCVAALIVLLAFSSCMPEEMLCKLYNDNRDHKLELYLYSTCDTMFEGIEYSDVCSVVLANSERKPYYLLEPSVQQFDRLKSYFRYCISIDYQNENCAKCYMSLDNCSECDFSEETIFKTSMPKRVLLRSGKPFVYKFSPMFSYLDLYCCESNDENNKYGKYQLKASYVIDGDTIYSNPVTIQYLERPSICPPNDCSLE